MVKKDRSRLPKLSKLSVAILENLVEKVIGAEAIDEIKAPHARKELSESLGEALAQAEKTFINQHKDKDARDALLQLPINDLPSVQDAIWTYYKRPNSKVLHKVLIKRLGEGFSKKQAKPTVEAFLQFLKQELINIDSEIRDKIKANTLLDIKEELQKLVKQGELKGGVEAAALKALHQLPAPPGDFTGREKEYKELLGKIKTGGVNISGLQGMGGIGKTVLALKLAAELTADYPDAQFYLDLKGADKQDPLTPADAMAHVIRAYQPTVQLPEGEAELQPIYQSVLHGQRALLLMDNARDAAQVQLLIPPESCVLLVTSRQHFTLPGLFTKDLNRMDKKDAKTLLLKIAPRIKQGADKIAKLCDYLPLALRVAASALAERADLDVMTFIQLLDKTETRLKMLPGLESSLNLSYELLSKALQAKWRAGGLP
ncbi:MAG: hypothetical protein IH859_02465 [Chloroflexi bacterium]|nr:hypothetical protein [Chloroflexota bacterium]